MFCCSCPWPREPTADLCQTLQTSAWPAFKALDPLLANNPSPKPYMHWAMGQPDNNGTEFLAGADGLQPPDTEACALADWATKYQAAGASGQAWAWHDVRCDAAGISICRMAPGGNRL